MKIFKELFKELSGYQNISQALDKNISPVSVTGLSHIHRSQLIYALSGEKTNLVITGSEAEAKKLCDDINMMSGENTAVLFPSKELVLTSVDSSSGEYEHMRISALENAEKILLRFMEISQDYEPTDDILNLKQRIRKWLENQDKPDS